MLQADMIAFRESGEGYQCAFPDRNDDKDLTGLAIEVVNYYVPELEVLLKQTMRFLFYFILFTLLSIDLLHDRLLLRPPIVHRAGLLCHPGV